MTRADDWLGGARDVSPPPLGKNISGHYLSLLKAAAYLPSYWLFQLCISRPERRHPRRSGKGAPLPPFREKSRAKGAHSVCRGAGGPRCGCLRTCSGPAPSRIAFGGPGHKVPSPAVRTKRRKGKRGEEEERRKGEPRKEGELHDALETVNLCCR